MANVKYISYEETVQCIADTANQMLFMLDTTMDKKSLELISSFAEKFVLDCMDYCHRTDFPRSLAYTGAELAVKYSKDTLNQSQGPLKSLKENDVEFTWAVSDMSPIGCISEQDFDSIKSKLNLYRKVVWSNGNTYEAYNKRIE
ncbi:hypothetical protein [Veillonella montpellierensis]|uniref:hypothetical protein n=1 Tax=Veillonella montpellierensis TaxID=187328 RepID=UPI0023F9A380|nr:hypothetical protein [Veillonella montpellierensis]